MIYNQFYSSQNIINLKNNINNDLGKKYNIESINVQLEKCMSYVKNNVSSTPPDNCSIDKYLNLMNKKVYNLVISYYEKSNKPIENKPVENKQVERNQIESNKPIENNKLKIDSESTKIGNNLFDSEILKNYSGNNTVIDYPKPSGINNNININDHTEKLKQERETMNPKVSDINFNLDETDDNINTVDLYNDLLTTYNDQVNDLTSYEDNQKIINQNVENKLTILEEENENSSNNNINKLTPITNLSSLPNNNNNNNNFSNTIGDFQSFLNNNNTEIKKDNIPRNINNNLNNNSNNNVLDNNGSTFSENSLTKKDFLLKEPDYYTVLKTDYIVIDSRYRNFELYPNQCNFVVKFSSSDNNFLFNTYVENGINIIQEKKIVIGNQSENDIGETFDNIYSVHLDNAIVPAHSFEYNTHHQNDKSLLELSLTIFKDSYLLLEIPELRSPYKGGNTIFKKSFAILRINHGSSLTSITYSNNFTNLIVPNEIMTYDQSSLGKLDKFSIKLNNKNGRIYNFGIDKLFIKNFTKGTLKYLGICGGMEYSTKFEINRTHSEYSKICKNYYNINNCNILNNNPLIIRDLIYLYHIVPNENQIIFFEDGIKIDVFKKTDKNIKISLFYKLNNKKHQVNYINLFESFKIVNEELNNYYIIIIINGEKYYLRVSHIDDDFIYLYNYDNLPTFNKNKVKVGLSKGDKTGANNEQLDSLFYSSGFNVISVENINDDDDIGDDNLGKYIIEIDYPYNKLPKYITENNFTSDDLFLIQDKKQISYGFTIKYNIKDYSKVKSTLNESGHN